MKLHEYRILQEDQNYKLYITIINNKSNYFLIHNITSEMLKMGERGYNMRTVQANRSEKINKGTNDKIRISFTVIHLLEWI